MSTTAGAWHAALDELADAVTDERGRGTVDAACFRARLSTVVRTLEGASGTSLGTTDGDPLVVLQRRFARAHRELVRAGAAGGPAADASAGTSVASPRAEDSSVGAASVGAASVGAVSVGAVSVGAVSVGAASMGAASGTAPLPARSGSAAVALADRPALTVAHIWSLLAELTGAPAAPDRPARAAGAALTSAVLVGC